MMKKVTPPHPATLITYTHDPEKVKYLVISTNNTDEIS